MPRKIIQIAVANDSVLGFTVCRQLYALCDDGTIWIATRYGDKDKKWERVTLDNVTKPYKPPYLDEIPQGI